MHFEFELSRKEYRQACAGIAAIPSPAASRRTALQRAGIITAAVGLLAVMKRDSLPDWLAPSLLIVTGLAIVIVPLWRAFTSVDDAWERASSQSRSVSIDAGESGMSITSHGWRTEMAWDRIKGVLETRDLFILFSDAERTDTLIILPKHAMGDAAGITAFRGYLRQADPPVGGAFPVVQKGASK